MKTRVFISKKLIITVVIFTIGLMFLFKGINSYFKHNQALSLETLTESECKKGSYVVGNIDSYVIYRIKENNKVLGSSDTLLTYTKAYEFYTVPIAQNSYIRIMVSDKDMLSKLKNFIEGKGESFYFEGEIVDSPIEFNYKWYAAIEGFNAEDVIKPYVIKEINFESNKSTIYIGILLVVFSALLFFADGGVKSVVSKDIDDANITGNRGSRSNDYTNSYNKRNEILIEIRQLESYENRLSELKKKCIIGFVLLGIGIYIIVSSYLWEIKLIGILLIILSIKSIWKYFINSNNRLARQLVKLFGIESLSEKIDECKDNIDKMENY
ncbi:MAG: hypothetical protein J1E98_12750 [Lachnospiraceae bacterium]|nr:hypothetical protein [Lachnospiraceae bacterium]